MLLSDIELPNTNVIYPEKTAIVALSPDGDDDDDEQDDDWTDIDDEDFEDMAADMDDVHEMKIENNILDEDDDDHLPDDDF
ncbi:hypothetical protein [Mucilaginibacter sp.]|uniref:hypothetical protein n=1 Tax=Mucilaginibacter sp. TaxID=1882438 RepID=UPI003D1108B0